MLHTKVLIFTHIQPTNPVGVIEMAVTPNELCLYLDRNGNDTDAKKSRNRVVMTTGYGIFSNMRITN